MGQRRFAAFLIQRSKSSGSTPLNDVASRGYEDLVKLLLWEYYADYEVCDNGGNTILHRAVQTGHEELLGVFLEHMQRSGDTEKGRRVLAHRNNDPGRTVREALEVRGKRALVEYVRRFEGY